MSSSTEESIIETLCYADVFDYPLTLEEVCKWLIKIKYQPMAEKIKKEKLEIIIRTLRKIKKKNGYYFLEGRKEIVDIRKKREKYSCKKIKIAQKITVLLKLIPTIKLVGITGALALNNARKDDDIDLFIITSSGFLWITRLLVTIIIECTGCRRHPEEKNINNKICFNMFIDENHLFVGNKERDLFSAHEILQMKPLFVRDNVYRKFLQENNWVEKYLPNIHGELTLAKSDKEQAGWRNRINIFWLIEDLLKKFQLWYMKNRRTTEIISDGIIRFHPHDAREWVMKRYREKIKRYI